MLPHYYLDLIACAVRERDGRQFDLLVDQLRDAERAREILRANGYGETGMSSAGVTVARVPAARMCGLTGAVGRLGQK